MKNPSFVYALSFLLLLAAGCDEKKGSTVPPWPWQDPAPADTVAQSDTSGTVDPIDPVGPSAPEWADVTAEYGKLPAYVKILKAPAKLQDQNAVAFIADVDLSQTSFHVWGIKDIGTQGTTDSFKTPGQVYSDKGSPAVVINGGFFFSDGGKRYAASLAANNGDLLSTNINYASQDWVSIYYPTRAVFLEHSDGTFEAAWSYYKSLSEHWIYQEPAENLWSDRPLKAPSATFPVKGAAYEAVNGIGGGPVLLKGGEIKNTYRFELFDGSSGIGCTERHPRTAIGITADKHLVLFVCEGRNMTPDVPGFTTAEVARILKDYGCTDAINLDGGGSTLMLAGGREVIKPSDGKQRSVASCVYIN